MHRGLRQGQSLVEFALALPILLVIVFGLIEFAIAFRTFQLVTNVAREGARLAVIPSSSDAAVGTLITNLLNNSGLNAGAATVTLSCNGSPGLCSGVGSTGTSDAVQIDYPHTFVFFGPVMNLMCSGCGSSYGTITLSSTSTMRNE